MRRVQNAPPDEIAMQVSVASQLFEHDRRLVEEAQKRQAATVAAEEMGIPAEEMGIPAEYMERAAQELRARRAARTRDSLRRRVGVAAVLFALMDIGVGWLLTHRPSPPAPPPIVYRLGDMTQAHWDLRKEGADASMTINPTQGHGGVITVDISRFRLQSDEERFIADVETNQVPPTLAGYQTVSFRVRGHGLGQIRLFLESSDGERWVSPFLTAAGPWHQHRLRLNQFLRQTPGGNWHDAPYQTPHLLGKVVFKLGAHANPVTDHGEVQIDDLRFE